MTTEQKPQQVPSVGRVVHFVNGTAHVPAIITDPSPEPREGALVGLALTVFPVDEPPFTTRAMYDEAGAPATWHWPEFVPAR